MQALMHVAHACMICCKSTCHHEKASNKTMADYPHVINQKKYSQKGLMLEQRIPCKWKCGKCHKINPKGMEHCIFCDQMYKLEYMMTDDIDDQGEDSHNTHNVIELEVNSGISGDDQANAENPE